MRDLNPGRIKVALLSLAMAGSLAALSATASGPSSPSLISVTVLVTDAQTGNPVNQAQLTLVFREKDGRLSRAKSFSFSAKTDVRGRCKFLYVPEGTVQLLATHERHQTFGKEFEVSKEHAVLEVKLKPPQPLL